MDKEEINEKDIIPQHLNPLDKNFYEYRLLDINFNLGPLNGQFYHYTSPEGMKGILENRFLYFSDAQFLNDYNEKKHINDILNTFWNSFEISYDKKFKKLLKDIRISEFEDSGYNYLTKNGFREKSRYFVFSTSYSPDNLSLWKYYAKNNTYTGYTIGLSTLYLIDEWIDADTGVEIIGDKVLYSNYEKFSKIHSTVNILYEAWCKYEESKEVNERIVSEFKAWLSITSLFFKEECFEDEKEFRFVAVAPDDSINTLSFNYNGYDCKMIDHRIINGALIPFLKIPFNFWDVDGCGAIKSIGIGPTNNADLMEKSLKYFIDSLNYKLYDCKIYRSKIPLRY